jgi:hypothetical protein
VKEESQLEDMRAALRGDRERAESARLRSAENVRALLVPEPGSQPDSPAPGRQPGPPPRRSGLFARLFGR